VLIWAVLAALALALFTGMSLLALAARLPGSQPDARTPAPLPTPADISSSGVGETPAAPLPEATATPAQEPGGMTAMLGLWLSALSAITALIGLASSLWLGWRKEGREVAQHALELERARLEIRKLQQELATTPHQSGERE
jgi:hypothetical protein